MVPGAGVVAGVMTNLITTGWNWWIFGGLVVLSMILTVGTVIDSPLTKTTVDKSALASAEPPSGTLLSPPTGTRVFTGRTQELSQLSQEIPDKERLGPLLLVITGMAGTGKTQLAIRVSHELVSRYPDGQFWLGLRTYAATESRMGTAEALRTLLNALDVAPDPRATDVTALSQKWRSVTVNRRLLIILDDVDDADQVQPVMPAGEGCAALITSRHVLIGLDPDRAVALEPFSEDEAKCLAESILQRTGQTDSFAAIAIAAAYRLPLAVRQVTDLKAANPSLDIAELISINSGQRDEAAAALALSLGALTADARLVLRRVAHYPGSLITPAIAATMTDRLLTRVNLLLSELYQHGLLIAEHRSSGYRMHDLIRAAALRESAARDSRRQLAACNDRLFRYIDTAIAESVWMLYRGSSVTGLISGRADRPNVPPPRHETDVAALTWLDQYHADLIAGVQRF